MASDASGRRKLLSEGIPLVLSRWTALQMAIQNAWGGMDSQLKVQELVDSILRWFSTQYPKGELYIDDLENLLDESMILSFNAEIDDGSIEEVAEQLMIIHEECLQGKFDLLTKLRDLTAVPTSVSLSRQVVGENEGDSSDEEASEMMVDEPKTEATSTSHRPMERDAPDEEGWSVVGPRRGRGKR